MRQGTGPRMTRDSLAALGREFRRLGMKDHVEALAAYWRSNQGNVPPYGWTDEHVRGWLARLRIPPHAETLPVKPKGSACPACGPSIFGARRALVSFPGGAEFICDGCRATWLELDTQPVA